MKNRIAVALAVLGCAGIGCKPKPKDAIVGRWQNVQAYTSRLEFKGDATWASINLQGMAMVQGRGRTPGTYEFVGEDKVRLTLTIDGKKVDAGTITVSFKSDQMIVKKEDGVVQVWKRID